MLLFLLFFCSYFIYLLINLLLVFRYNIDNCYCSDHDDFYDTISYYFYHIVLIEIMNLKYDYYHYCCDEMITLLLALIMKYYHCSLCVYVIIKS